MNLMTNTYASYSRKNKNKNKNKYYEWHRYSSNSGKPFYYSPLTHESQWEIPDYNAIIVDTRSPTFTDFDGCVMPPAYVSVSTVKPYNNKKRVCFGYSLNEFENMIAANVDKLYDEIHNYRKSNAPTMLATYQTESGEIILGIKCKSELELMEEGFWMN